MISLESDHGYYTRLPHKHPQPVSWTWACCSCVMCVKRPFLWCTQSRKVG